MIRILFAILGFFVLRWPGAALGYLLGYLFEFIQGPAGNSRTGQSFRDAFERGPEVSPADFELNLLSLCSIIIKADGEASQRELDYVRQYFVSTYGREKANAIFRTFNEVVKKREVSTERIAGYLAGRTRYATRLQIVHFLFGIAGADGGISEPELIKLQEIAGHFRLRERDFESIKAMFFKSTDHAYRILEIDKSVSDQEVKKAYRRMAKKYHPDRVVTQDEAIKKGAEEKFKEVQKAYERIQEERGVQL